MEQFDVDYDWKKNWIAHSYSQIGTIAGELQTSIRDWYRLHPEEKRLDYPGVANALLACLRNAAWRSPGHYSLMRLSVGDFLSETEGMPPSTRDALRLEYDTLWDIRSASSVVVERRLTPEETKEPDLEMLDEATKRYLGGDGLVSESLERLLLNAYVFVEVIAFARTLEPIIPFPKGGLGIFLRTIWHYLKFIVSEGFAVLITAMIAAGIDSTNGVGFWSVLSTITIIRWLRRRFDVKPEAFRLLGEMMAIQQRLMKPVFHPRSLREFLLEVERKGAVFNGNVYFLLDKMESRGTLAGH